jgi:hypothetical protein
MLRDGRQIDDECGWTGWLSVGDAVGGECGVAGPLAVCGPRRGSCHGSCCNAQSDPSTATHFNLLESVLRR